MSRGQVSAPDPIRADFEAWMRRVDAHIMRVTGAFDSGDLPDQPYRAWYDDGMSPLDAAFETLIQEGYDPSEV